MRVGGVWFLSDREAALPVREAPNWAGAIMYRKGEDLCDWASAQGITIYQRSKTVWIAAGSYRGRDFEVKGRSPAIALAVWMAAARYVGPRR